MVGWDSTMVKTPTPGSAESERLELDAVVAALERTPKLVKLLRYLAEKRFAGESDHLTEYNIATEVFGREKTVFIASEDAVARVETHRLRKRLKEYYDGEGKCHPIQIAIPLGTYVPVFLGQNVDTGSLIEQADGTEAQEPENTAGLIVEMGERLSKNRTGGAPSARLGPDRVFSLRPGRRAWVYGLIAAAILLSALGVYRVFISRRAATDDSSVQTAAGKKANPGPGQSDAAMTLPIPLRIIAGYDGPPQRDSAGDVWQADRYFHDGWRVHQSSVFIARTSDPLIFRYGRAGGFDYDIPLNPGLYELHLYFFAPSEALQSEDAENQNAFNVTINGKVVLQDFDIVSDAMGRNVADERVLRDISPAADGILHLHFSTVFGTPSLSAIQVVNGTPRKQLPIRIVTQANALTDRYGQLWHPDSYYLGGRHLSHNIPGSVSSDPDLFSTERFGHFSYALPVDSRDRYTVVLHFAELFFGADAQSPGSAGSRVFRVMCNEDLLLDDFDIYKEVGSIHPLTKTFHHLKPTAQGKLNLTFEPIENYATVSAIEVLDESN